MNSRSDIVWGGTTRASAVLWIPIHLAVWSSRQTRSTGLLHDRRVNLVLLSTL